MLPDRVSNPGPLTYESGALPIALRGPVGSETRSITYYLKVKIPEFFLWYFRFALVCRSVLSMRPFISL